MNIDVAIAIDAESELATYAAPAAGEYVEGVWVATAQEAVNIRAVFQPVTGKALQDLPEGLQDKVAFMAWSRTPVLLDGRVFYGGVEYRVVFLWERVMDGFNKFALSRKGPAR